MGPNGPYNQEAELQVEAHELVCLAVAFTWPDRQIPNRYEREEFARDLARIWSLPETPFHHPLS